MKVAPNGDIFIAETRAGRIRVLRAAAGEAKPSVNKIYASALNRPFGIAFFPSGNNPRRSLSLHGGRHQGAGAA
jgi:glucose/arabinose dehydrogenase